MAKLSLISHNPPDFDDFPCEYPSPDSLKKGPASGIAPEAEGHDYNFSALEEACTPGTTSNGLEELEYFDESRRISEISTVSSFPESESHIVNSTFDQYVGPRTPTKSEFVGSQAFERSGGHPHPMTSPRAVRDYHAAFRHPSSVKAMQMRDEILSETQSVVRHHRRNNSQRSIFSHRSSYSASSSPTKRSSRSHHGTPQKASSNLKKEFPLVLLHCTLLPPVLLPTFNHDENLISELLPEKYRKRWIALRDKLLADTEVSTRGILIPHPRDEYELLEERLLESLELEKPRIRHNHFLPADSASGDSGFESGSHSEDEAECELLGHVECPDCGTKLSQDDLGRRWEVKVYAANGLMRAGAWAAAWREMEKVDVEIRVWLPEDVRREVEAKLAEIAAAPPELEDPCPDSFEQHLDTAQTRDPEIYGDVTYVKNQGETDGLRELPAAVPVPEPRQVDQSRSAVQPERKSVLHTLTRAILKDQRNILVGLLSILVLFFALTGKEQPRKEQAELPMVRESAHVLTTTVTSTSMEITTTTVTASGFGNGVDISDEVSSLDITQESRSTVAGESEPESESQSLVIGDATKVAPVDGMESPTSGPSLVDHESISLQPNAEFASGDEQGPLPTPVSE